MKRGRLRKSEWRLLNEAYEDQMELRYNWPLRLRNALLVLSASDPGWIYWVENNVPLNLTVRQVTRLIERRARALAVRGYSFSRGQWLAIVYSDAPFNELGSLQPR